MAHVEFSITDPSLTPSQGDLVLSSLDRWAAVVAYAPEPSLVIDGKGIIVAVSASFEDLLGITERPIDRPLLDGVLQLLDFGDGRPLDISEIAKTPPLLALTSGRLARGLVRVQCASGPRTFDAIATPLLQEGGVAGSLTFFSTV